MKKILLLSLFISLLVNNQLGYAASVPASFHPHIPEYHSLAPPTKPLKGIKKWLVKRMIKKAARKQQKKNAPGAILSFLSGLISFLFGNILSVAFLLYTSVSILILVALIALIISTVSGILALRKFKESPEQYKGKGFATVGTILAGATVFSWLVVVFAYPF